MQIITIAGNVTKDGEIRHLNNGDPVLGFSVAVNGIGRDAPSTFFDCSLFGKRGEALAPMITKGGKVAVSGTFGTREHNGKTYLTVRATEVTLQGGKPQAQAGTSYDDPAPRKQATNSYAAMDDDIPFACEWR